MFFIDLELFRLKLNARSTIFLKLFTLTLITQKRFCTQPQLGLTAEVHQLDATKKTLREKLEQAQ